MPQSADTKRLSAEALCEIVGISHQRRERWVKRGLVAPLDAGGGGMLDAVELATFAALSGALRRDDVPLAWAEVHARLRDQVPGPVFDVVFDLQLRETIVATNDEELLEAIRRDRPIRVVSIGATLQGVKGAFARMAEKPAPPYPAKPDARKSARDAEGYN